jgi:hypothetical protein
MARFPNKQPKGLLKSSLMDGVPVFQYFRINDKFMLPSNYAIYGYSDFIHIDIEYFPAIMSMLADIPNKYYTKL